MLPQELPAVRYLNLMNNAVGQLTLNTPALQVLSLAYNEGEPKNLLTPLVRERAVDEGFCNAQWR